MDSSSYSGTRSLVSGSRFFTTPAVEAHYHIQVVHPYYSEPLLGESGRPRAYLQHRGASGAVKSITAPGATGLVQRCHGEQCLLSTPNRPVEIIDLRWRR